MYIYVFGNINISITHIFDAGKRKRKVEEEAERRRREERAEEERRVQERIILIFKTIINVKSFNILLSSLTSTLGGSGRTEEGRGGSREKKKGGASPGSPGDEDKE